MKNSRLLLLLPMFLLVIPFLDVNAQADTVVTRCTEAALNNALYSGQTSIRIRFNCDGTIRLTNAKKLAHSVRIDGSDHKVVLDGQYKTGIFIVAPGANVALDHLTFTHAAPIVDENAIAYDN